jgi:2-methylisocitrate lyase-like PEP mutase family enzyme
MSHRKRLRRRLSEDRILVLPGAADAITARVIEQTGFDAAYVTGAGFANASFGRPDIGLITLTEVLEHVHRIARVVDIPLIVDADTGYGGVLNVRRTVAELEHVGASAIQIEDQAEPKRCGHFDGNSLVTTEEMVQRLAAAIDARTDPDLVIIARTDAYQSEGLDGALERAKAYVAAGADALFIEAPTSLADLKRLPGLVDAPLIANMVEGGKTPMATSADLERMGFRVALFANTALRTAVHAVQESMRVLLEEGDTASLHDRMLSWDDRQQLIGLPEMQAMEERLLSVTVDHPLGSDGPGTRQER